MCYNLKTSVYLGTVIHLIIGFVAVTNTAVSMSEMVKEKRRLILFWSYMCPYFVLGFLFLSGVHKKRLNLLRVSVVVFLLLQLSLFVISLKYFADCKLKEEEGRPSMEDAISSMPSTKSIKHFPQEIILTKSTTNYSNYCNHQRMVVVFIILPMFFHTVIFTSLLVAFIFRLQNQMQIQKSAFSNYRHCNIQIIVEEFP